MSLPGGNNYVAETEDNDAFIMEVLQSLSAQQNEHVELVEQVESFQEFWDSQQKWNHFAQKNKALKENNHQIQLKHAKDNEERRIQRLMMQHQFDLEDEKSKRKNATELGHAQQELAEHRKEWEGVIQDLNTCQESMHAKWSGRLVLKKSQKQECDRNKALLETVAQRLHQRMQQKQVATGISVGEGGEAPATGALATSGPFLSAGGAAQATGGTGISAGGPVGGHFEAVGGAAPATSGPFLSAGGAAQATGGPGISAGGPVGGHFFSDAFFSVGEAPPAMGGPFFSVGGAPPAIGFADIAGGGGKVGIGRNQLNIADGGESRATNGGRKRNRVSMDSSTGNVSGEE